MMRTIASTRRSRVWRAALPNAPRCSSPARREGRVPEPHHHRASCEFSRLDTLWPVMVCRHRQHALPPARHNRVVVAAHARPSRRCPATQARAWAFALVELSQERRCRGRTLEHRRIEAIRALRARWRDDLAAPMITRRPGKLLRARGRAQGRGRCRVSAGRHVDDGFASARRSGSDEGAGLPNWRSQSWYASSPCLGGIALRAGPPSLSVSDISVGGGARDLNEVPSERLLHRLAHSLSLRRVSSRLEFRPRCRGGTHQPRVAALLPGLRILRLLRCDLANSSAAQCFRASGRGGLRTSEDYSLPARE